MKLFFLSSCLLFQVSSVITGNAVLAELTPFYIKSMIKN